MWLMVAYTLVPMNDLIILDTKESDLDCFNAVRMHPEVPSESETL